MSWSEIKYALNSTLGTNDFIPLNEYIDSLIVVSPTSDILATGTSTTSNETTVFEKEMNIPGQMKLEVTATFDNYSTNNTGKCYVYINDILVTSVKANPTSNYDSVIFSVSENDKLTLKTELGSYVDSVTYTLYGGLSFGKNIFK